jgi:hypothetical protein
MSGSVPPVRSAPTPRPPGSGESALAMNSAAPQPAETPKLTAGAEPPPAAQPPASTATANRPPGPGGAAKAASSGTAPSQPAQTPGKN